MHQKNFQINIMLYALDLEAQTNQEKHIKKNWANKQIKWKHKNKSLKLPEKIDE